MVGNRGFSRWLLVPAVLGTLALRPKLAAAQPETASESVPFRVVFSSSTACREAAEFTDQLRRRTSRLRPAAADEPATAFLVDIRESETGVEGRLTLWSPSSEPTDRRVPGADCHEVISALALIAALSVDPLALTGELSEPAVVAPVQPAVGAAPDHPAPSQRSRALAWRVGERLTWQGGMAPGATPGLSLTAAIGTSATGAEEVQVWSWLGLSAAYARKTVQGREGAAEFELASGRLTACPWTFRFARRVEVAPCAGLDLGRLRASGIATPNAASKVLFWGAGVVEGQLSVELVGPLALGIGGAALFPFSREEFFFIPTETIHRIPAVAGAGFVAVELRFF